MEMVSKRGAGLSTGALIVIVLAILFAVLILAFYLSGDNSLFQKLQDLLDSIRGVR